jgi:hypothetical protein
MKSLLGSPFEVIRELVPTPTLGAGKWFVMYTDRLHRDLVSAHPQAAPGRGSGGD